MDDAGKSPSSGSMAFPEKLTVVPATYFVSADGVKISATGSALLITVSVAVLLVIIPEVLVTTTR
jgi:hypothetical protein